MSIECFDWHRISVFSLLPNLLLFRYLIVDLVFLWVNGTVEWERQLRLTDVTAGIEISTDLDQDSLDVTVTSKDNTANIPDLGFDIGNKRDQLEGQFRDALKDIPFRETEEKLQEDLSGAAHFAVPGQGTFAYKSLVLNNAGNLIRDINYA
ncbi:hypothetical protein BDV10DRAFT_189926 [Aspergillus recurvatus]